MTRKHFRVFSWATLFLLSGAAVAARADDAVKARVLAVEAGKYDSDIVIVLDETDVTVQADGIGVNTQRNVVKVLREGGIRGQSVQRFSFDPTTNRIALKVVRVYRANGSVETVPVETAAVQPQPQWGIFWGNQNLVVSVPRLEVGDAVETVLEKTGFNVAYLERGQGAEGPRGEQQHGQDARATQGGRAFGATKLEPPMPGHWYDEVEFYSSVPVIERRYTVRVPKNKPLQFEVYNGEVKSSVKIEGEHIVYSFEKRDIMPFSGEPHMVATTDVGCKVVLATLEDWFKKSRWFHEKNEPQFESNDEIKAKVREVIAGCQTDEEKITALNHWVAENIRYIGTSRGSCEGYTTHAARETFRDRGGVCKDKAGLLVTMLREAGFDSYIVMTQAGSDVTPIPADQFNHAVTSIRQKDGTFRLLDPTWMPKSRENWSSAEQLQHVVYGVPEGVNLTRSPYSGPENNWVKWQGQSALDANGDLQTKIDFSAAGVPETNLRRALAGRHPSERIRLLEDWIARLSPATKLARAEAMDAVDFSGPLQVRYDARADGYALGHGERRYWTLPMMKTVLAEVVLSDMNGATTLEKRKYPVRLRSTRRIEIRETVTLPAGWKVVDKPAPQKIDGPAASLSFEIQESGGKLEYVCQMDLKKHRVPPEEYANFKQALDKFNELCGRYIVCETDSRRAQTDGPAGSE